MCIIKLKVGLSDRIPADSTTICRPWQLLLGVMLASGMYHFGIRNLFTQYPYLIDHKVVEIIMINMGKLEN